MKRILIIIFLCGFYISASANDSIKTKRPHFLVFNTSDGFVFPTNEFVSGDHRIPHYTSFALKYGISSTGDDWKDYAYGMPYGGIGIYTANFYRDDDLGNPFSIYFFQGAQLKKFRRNLTLNYEWNLGGSFNWKHYDPFDNPNNIALGSSVNIHVSGNLYLKWRLSRRFDLHAGAGFTHFSNGASSLPNSGLNMISAFVEIAYYINRENESPSINTEMIPPKFEKRTEHDLMFLISSRHARVDTLYTGLASEFTNKKFNVLGISYAYMFRNSYRYKWGPSLEVTYDESSGIKSWRETHPETQKTFDRVKLSKFSKRISVGLSLKGEISMPSYSIFANMGYDVIHGNPKNKRIYQILGIKVFLRENLFGTFGIRATNFGKAQYLYWNLGYTFTQYKKKKI